MYAVVVPGWEAPDEWAHMRYIEHLMANGSLPVQRQDVFGEEHQAPLYYLIAALPISLVDRRDTTGAFRWNRRFAWDGHGDVNIAIHAPGERLALRGDSLALTFGRGVSIVMGAATVLLTVTLGLIVFPERRKIALLAATLVAFNPQFLFISAAINNDNLVTLCFNLCLFQLVRIAMGPEPPPLQAWGWVGIWLSAALLAKTNAVTLVPLVGFVMWLRRTRGDTVADLTRAAALVAIWVTALAGWWFVRNQILYGDPLGMAPFRESTAGNAPVSFVDLPAVASMQFRSLWGYFGWLTVPAPTWFYLPVAGVVLISMAGLLKTVRRQVSIATARGLSVILLAIATQELFQLTAITRFGISWAQGRYLFPILPSLALLVSTGIAEIVPKGSFATTASFLGVLLALSALYLLFGVIAPAYAIG